MSLLLCWNERRRGVVEMEMKGGGGDEAVDFYSVSSPFCEKPCVGIGTSLWTADEEVALGKGGARRLERGREV